MVKRLNFLHIFSRFPNSCPVSFIHPGLRARHSHMSTCFSCRRYPDSVSVIMETSAALPAPHPATNYAGSQRPCTGISTPEELPRAVLVPAVLSSSKDAYPPQPPIQMVQQRVQQQPYDEAAAAATAGLRGGRGGCCECCMYCCGIVVLIKCLDSFCN